VTVTVEAGPPGTVVVNEVIVSANEVDPVPTNDAASVQLVVSALVLSKTVCNVSASATGCADVEEFALSVHGAPGDVLEYRVAFVRVGTPVRDVVLEDEVPLTTLFVADAYGAGRDVALLCPDALEPTYLAMASATTVVVDTLDAACGVATLEDGDGGRVAFRVVIP
jgi:hypothetical protein